MFFVLFFDISHFIRIVVDTTTRITIVIVAWLYLTISIMFRRHAPLMLTVAAGVFSGVYIWLPSFEELKRMNDNKPITSRDQLRPAPTYLPQEGNSQDVPSQSQKDNTTTTNTVSDK
ncbi:hypothetical protein BDF19DRAFT_429414 [Syncephalis fuscata]|nr:hypothetical protein BDF19DRAFT_429414 [Syncephalis fuscata]